MTDHRTPGQRAQQAQMSQGWHDGSCGTAWRDTGMFRTVGGMTSVPTAYLDGYLQGRAEWVLDELQREMKKR